MKANRAWFNFPGLLQVVNTMAQLQLLESVERSVRVEASDVALPPVLAQSPDQQTAQLVVADSADQPVARPK